MRIIAGEFRGRRLEAPEGLGTRPSPDRLREALFQILAGEYDFDGWPETCLDLYAGSGGLGFEALSRGVGRAVLVDSDPAVTEILRRSAQTLMPDVRNRQLRVEIRTRDAGEALEEMVARGERFPLILTAPPYPPEEYSRAVALLGRYPVAVAGGILVLQFDGKSLDYPPEIEGYSLRQERRYGRNGAAFYQYEPDGKESSG